MTANTHTYEVLGMTCAHCVSAVTEEVSAIPGVTGVSIELVPGGRSVVAVSSTAPLPEQVVGAAVEEAGYELVAADAGVRNG